MHCTAFEHCIHKYAVRHMHIQNVWTQLLTTGSYIIQYNWNEVKVKKEAEKSDLYKYIQMLSW